MARSPMSTPFVARAAQVERLWEAFEGASAGDPSLVVVAGDAGVGKTRLVRHVRSLAKQAGARTVVSACVDLGEIGLPYLPFAAALATLQGVEPDVVDAVVADRPALGRLLPGGTGRPARADEAQDRFELFEGVADVLARTGTAERPLLVVLEDLHWADASSRDLLRFLVSRLAMQHLLLVATYRTDDLHRRHALRPLIAELVRHPRVQRLELLPFDEPELREFTTALLGAPLDDDTFGRVVARSEGNAYFAEELLAAGPETDELPWSLIDVLRVRLEALQPASQRLAELVAAAGRSVPETLLRAAAAADDSAVLSGPGAVDLALRDAVAQHVLAAEDGGRIAFRHALLAEAVYGDLLPGEKSGLHRAYLRAMQADPTVASSARLASHALRAPDLDVALTASYAAAHEAQAVLAPEEQLQHLEVVLRLWDAAPRAVAGLPEDHVALLGLAAGAASEAGRADHALQLARAAVDETGHDPRRQAGCRTALARFLLDADRVHEARTEASRAVAVLDEPSADRAWALATYARAAMNVDLDEEAEVVAAQALEVARAVGATDAESDALTTRALLVRESPERSEELLEAALVRAEESGDLATELRTRFNLVSGRYYAGDLAGAAALAASSVARAERLGASRGAYTLELRWMAELIRYQSGDLTPGSAARAPVDQWDEHTSWLAVACTYAAVARGDEDAVERGRALVAHRDRDPQILLIAGGTTVDALRWRGEPDAAVELAADVMTGVAASWGEYALGGIWVCALALAAHADAAEEERLAGRDVTPRLEAGERLLAHAEDTAVKGRPRGGRLGPEGRGWAARTRAEHARLNGRPEPELWAAVVAEFGSEFRYEVARARWRWAEALLAVGDRSGAQGQALTALAEAEAMGARPLATAVRALARRGRLELPGTRAETADVLTAREAEVLRLVAQGLSNRQIGERLFISAKTVSVHISNLLAKLGVSGRAEAVAVAHHRGLLS